VDLRSKHTAVNYEHRVSTVYNYVNMDYKAQDSQGCSFVADINDNSGVGGYGVRFVTISFPHTSGSKIFSFMLS